MGKIVVLAGDDDSESVKAALDSASLDYELVKPTAANLLHIAIGMVDDEPTEPAPTEEPVPEAPAEKPEASKDEEPPKNVGGAGGTPPESTDDVQESLGFVTIDGEQIKAVRGSSATSVLRSINVQAGAKTTYSINESVFSFWAADPNAPATRLTVKVGNHQTSIELPVKSTVGTETYLAVGADLIDLFKKA